jgi:hypothetical protein
MTKQMAQIAVFIPALVFVASVLGQPQVGDKLMLTPEEMRYAAANPALPAGLATAVIAGNSAQAGVYVMRVRLPANFKIPPHFAMTRSEEAVVQVTAQGPTGTNPVRR